ncbi:MAG TPA: allantoate amidohydrolase [Candidatus Didemnitutus sp.]|nr:allantoate amidohydrolase [Candidatus Didemnitutus sp.]
MGAGIDAELVRKLEQLGRVSDVPGELTRTFLSPAMQRANDLVGKWMRQARLETTVDAAGNLIGRLAGPHREAPTLVLGSHLDTVRNAGKFDGALGVLLPIVALGELRRRGVTLPFAIEVVGFSEEEGVRFSSAYLGSKGFCGRLKAADLALRDEAGISVAEAMAGAKPRRKMRDGKSSHRDWLGYFEVHIEQGPVLEKRNLAVGVVSAIAGQSRFRLRWTGKAGHAGTTPMDLRRDALAGAAEFALAVEALARKTSGLVATVGQVSVRPGAANVIPGETVHSLDVRHARDAVRKKALFQLGRLAASIARKRGLTVHWQRTQDNPATACARELTATLARSVKKIQGPCPSLVSGAGHDGVVVSLEMPITMLFVRCRDGLSHHPDEYASGRDLGVALKVTIDFLEALARQQA